MDLCQPSVIKNIMNEAGIGFRKELGQNFLIKAEVPEEIAEAASDTENAMILEIGPGIGCLTKELCLRYKRVVAVELDAGLLPVLQRTVGEFDNLRVIHADALKLDLSRLVLEESGGLPVSVAANLPYYVTTPILMHLLESGVPFEKITVMVQKEVALRLAAPAGSPDYGAITAVLGYYGESKRILSVPAGCFMPAPKVDSAVLQITLYKEKPYRPKSEKLFFRTVKAAFAQRRKTLLNSLASGITLDKARVAEAITEAGFSEKIRGECLSTADFVRLSDALYEKMNG